MKELIRKLLREAIDVQSYKDWAQGISGDGSYEKWAIEHPERANRYWAIYSHIYDKIMVPIKSSEELKRAEQVVMPKLTNKEAVEAFKMFSMYKQDVLNGVLQEGKR